MFCTDHLTACFYTTNEEEEKEVREYFLAKQEFFGAGVADSVAEFGGAFDGPVIMPRVMLIRVAGRPFLLHP
jgi:hypothetical protein